MARGIPSAFAPLRERRRSAQKRNFLRVIWFCVKQGRASATVNCQRVLGELEVIVLTVAFKDALGP